MTARAGGSPDEPAVAGITIGRKRIGSASTGTWRNGWRRGPSARVRTKLYAYPASSASWKKTLAALQTAGLPPN